MNLKKNVGSMDSTIRIALAVVVAVLYFAGFISGTVAIILGILAVIFIVTSFVKFCPLYWPFGLSTRQGE